MDIYKKDRDQYRIVFLGVGFALKKTDSLTSEKFFQFIRKYDLCEDHFLSCFNSFEDFIQRLEKIEMEISSC